MDHRDRQTRKKRWSETEEDTVYTDNELDRSVVNVSPIRQVILNLAQLAAKRQEFLAFAGS